MSTESANFAAESVNGFGCIDFGQSKMTKNKPKISIN